MADDRETLGRAAFGAHVSGLAEEEQPPWEDKPPAWEELGGSDREFYMRIGAAVAATVRADAEAKLAATTAALRRHVPSFTDPEGVVLCGGCLQPAPCPDAALAGEEP